MNATAASAVEHGVDVSLTVNVVFRSVLCLAAALLCWVPMRVLWKNGELAATTFAIVTMIFNLYIGINAIIWHNDDTTHWWKGYGWCDLQVYTTFPLETVFAACIFTIIRHIANQVALLRVTGLSSQERRRKHLFQCLIIFTIPVIQLALMYFVLTFRYGIMTAVGCRPIYAESWVFIVFYIIPSPVFTALAVIYAVLVYVRYRQVSQSTREAFWNSSNTSVQTRSARTKRKLYFMAICIIIPYAPCQFAFLILNVLNGRPWTLAFNFEKTHGPMWGMIPLITSNSSNPVLMYQAYMLVFGAITIFLFFGRTKEAHDTYRRYLRFFGLGKIWPKLNEEWYPDNTPSRFDSTLQNWRSRVSSMLPTTTSGNLTRKDSLIPTVRHMSSIDGSVTLTSPPSTAPHSVVKAQDSAGSFAPVSSGPTTPSSQQVPQRNPWIFRTTPATTYPVRLPRIPIPSFFKRKEKRNVENINSLEFQTVPLDSVLYTQTDGPVTQPRTAQSDGSAGEPWARGAAGSAVRTKVWCPEEQDITWAGTERPDSGTSTHVLVQTQIDSSTEESQGTKMQ